MAGDNNSLIKDPVFERWADYRTNPTPYFRWTNRTIKLSLIYCAAIPLGIYWLAIKSDSKIDITALNRKQSLKDAIHKETREQDESGHSSKDGNCDDGPLFNEELFQEIKPFVHEENKRNEDEQKLDRLQQVAALAFLYLFASIEDKWALCSDILPVGAGLGSSAACSVCLATGLLLVLGHISIPNNNNNQYNEKTDTSAAKLINQWAYQVKKIIHGRTSGIDNGVTTYAVLYKMTSQRFPQIIDTILDAIENVSVFSKEILEKFDKIDISEFYDKTEDLPNQIVDQMSMCFQTAPFSAPCHSPLNILIDVL
nr:4245_t:CDS:10 [Entrophospora candida]